jgi:hypothetical protein
LHQAFDPAAPEEQASQRSVMAAKVEGEGKAAADIAQAVGQALRHLAQQGFMLAKAGCCTVAVTAPGLAVEDTKGVGRGGHGRHYAQPPSGGKAKPD